MDEWFGRRDRYLHTILTGESPSNDGICSLCQADSGHWRCKDCLGSRSVCRGCCRETHHKLPFHRIEYWNGNHYEDDWLCNVGVVIYLGHGGDPCPIITPTALLPILEQSSPHANRLYASPSGWEDRVDDIVSFTVGHTNGIHQVSVRPCG